MPDDDGRYHQLEHLLELALRLQGSLAGCSLDDVAEHFGVSRRTASRMLTAVRRALGEQNFEAERDTQGHKRWRLTRPMLNGLFRLDAVDFASLDSAAKLARREGERPLARALESVTSRLRSLSRPEWLVHVDPDLEVLSEAQGFACRAGPRPHFDAALIENLRHAILSQRRVQLLHRKQARAPARWQAVDPLGFLYGNRHYLVAWSRRRRHVVLFRLSRIREVRTLSERFDPPPGFSLTDFAHRSFGVFQEEPVDVAWRFRPRAAAEAREYSFHPDQELEERRDGSLVVRFRAGGLQEMAWHLFTWGPAVEVLEPAALRDELTRLLSEALRSHTAMRARRTGPGARARRTRSG